MGGGDRRFVLRSCGPFGIIGVVCDVGFGAEWEVDWVAVDDSLYVETLV